MFAVCAFFDLELDYCESDNQTILLVKHSWLKWLRGKYDT